MIPTMYNQFQTHRLSGAPHRVVTTLISNGNEGSKPPLHIKFWINQMYRLLEPRVNSSFTACCNVLSVNGSHTNSLAFDTLSPPVRVDMGYSFGKRHQLFRMKDTYAYIIM